MILTNEILEEGKSRRGGWSAKQMVALNNSDYKTNKGWKRQIIGKDYPEESIKLFLSLKDAHLRVREKNKPTRDLIPVLEKIPYKDQYLHPNWQKTRLSVLNRDNFRCVNCRDNKSTLHVHHIKYLHGKFIWDVPLYYMVTLCESCHSAEHGRDLSPQTSK